MRVTKHEHAALTLEKDGRKLIVDPGDYTSPIEDLTGLAGVVITHEHADHWSPAQLDRIIDAAPGIPILAPEGVARAAAGYPITVVRPGERVELSPFRLEFFGGRHAVIHESIPVVDNVGLLVDDGFYYPGDSYALPGAATVDLLAAPIGAPWLKIGDAMDFVLTVAPRRAFGTHDVTVSQIGRALGRVRLRWATEQHGGDFLELEPGDSVEV